MWKVGSITTGSATLRNVLKRSDKVWTGAIGFSLCAADAFTVGNGQCRVTVLQPYKFYHLETDLLTLTRARTNITSASPPFSTMSASAAHNENPITPVHISSDQSVLFYLLLMKSEDEGNIQCLCSANLIFPTGGRINATKRKLSELKYSYGSPDRRDVHLTIEDGELLCD